MSGKQIAIVALIAVAALAVVMRVAPIRNIVFGSTTPAAA